MGYANIFVSSLCRVSVKNRQLVVRGEEERKFAVEDINSVMLESGECTVSVYALRLLAESGGRKTGGIYPAFVFVKKGKKPRHRQRFSAKNQKNTIQNTAEKQANRGLSPSVCPSLLYHTKTQKGTKEGGGRRGKEMIASGGRMC